MHSSHACYIPSHLVLDFINPGITDEGYTLRRFALCDFLQFSVTSSLRSKDLQYFVFKDPRTLFLLRYQVSYPHKTTDKIMVSYIN